MITGLYAITPEGMAISPLLESVEGVLQAGAGTVQLRDKALDMEQWFERAQSVSLLCAKYGAAFILNDAPAAVIEQIMAQGFEAPGVHLGRDDLPVSQARKRWGHSVVVGASCYNQFDLAIDASKQGADYVAFGAVYASETKPRAVQAPLSLFEQAKLQNMNTVAIGGITVDKIPELLSAGADALAVIGALFGPQGQWHKPEKVAEIAAQWIEQIEDWRSKQ